MEKNENEVLAAANNDCPPKTKYSEAVARQVLETFRAEAGVRPTGREIASASVGFGVGMLVMLVVDWIV